MILGNLCGCGTMISDAVGSTRKTKEAVLRVSVAANLAYFLVIFSNVLMFSVFNFAILNFVGGISNLVVIVTCILSWFRDKNESENAAEDA